MTRLSCCLLAFLLLIGVCGAFSPASAQQSSPPPQQSSPPSNPENVGLGLKGIGARIGFVDAADASSTVAWGVHVDAGTFVQNVHIMPYFEYWSAGASVNGFDVNQSDLTIASDVNFDFPVQGQRITPYVGGGLGVHFLSAEANFPGGTSEDKTHFGLNIQGGVKNQIMPNISIFGEAKYTFVTDANQIKFMGGFTYNFIY